MLGNAEEAATRTEGNERDLALRQIAIAYADANDDDGVNRISAKIEATYHVTEVQVYYASSIARRGDLQHALYISQGIADLSERVTAIANTAVEAGHLNNDEFATGAFRLAVELAERMEGFERRDALSSIAVALARGGMVEQMRSIFESLTSPSPSSQYLMDAAIAVSSKGYYDIALQLIDRITSPITLAKTEAEIAGRMMQSGDVDRASELFGKAKRASDRVRETYDRIDLLTEIAVMAANFGDSEHATSFLDEAQGVAQVGQQPTRAELLAKIALASARAGDTERGQMLLNLSELSGQPGGVHYYSGELLSDIATAAAEAGKWPEAERLVARISESKEGQWTLVNLAAVAARHGDSDRADELASRINSPQMRIWVVAKIAVEMAGIGRFNEALQLAEQIEARNVKGWALIRIAATAGRFGDLAGVREVVACLHDSGQAILAMIEAAKSAHNYIKYECAHALLTDIADLVGPVLAFDRQAWIYAEIASLAASLPNPSNAQYWLEISVEMASQIADSSVRNRILSKTALAEARVSGISSAVQLIMHISGQDGRAWLLSDLATGLARSARSDDALNICSYIDDPLARAAALASIAIAAAARGDLSLAAQLIDEGESYMITGVDVARANQAAARIFDAAAMASEKHARRSLIRGLRSGVIGPWLARGILRDPTSLDDIMDVVLDS